MKLDALLPKIENLKFTPNAVIKELYTHVLDNKYKRILELGTAFGKGTVTMAAALEELGEGQVDTVDLKIADERFYSNSCQKLAEEMGLQTYINIYQENHTYNWFLKKKLEEQKRDNTIEPIYDFVFIDGAHNFTVDGLAFFICDKLLKPGGCILFDDLKYNYFDMNKKQGKTNEVELDTFDPRARVAKAAMGEDELKQCHIGLIYELLVKTNPNYGDFHLSNNGNWGYANKLGGDPTVRKSIVATTSGKTINLPFITLNIKKK